MRLCSPRILAVLFAIALPFSGASFTHALDLSVSTDDGLYLKWGNRGEIVEMKNGEQELQAELYVDRSGFFINDFHTGNDFSLRGQLSRNGDRVILAGAEADGYHLTATMESKGEYIEVKGVIHREDEEPADHAAKLSFRLPVDGNNSVWWSDSHTSRSINEASTFSLARKNFQIGGEVVGDDNRDAVLTTDLPFSSLGHNGLGLSFAVPMDKPNVVRQVYDSERGYLIEYDFGFSDKTSSKSGVAPNSANFHFYIYKHDPSNGLRASAQKYRELFPEYFTSKVDSSEMGLFIDDQGEISAADIDDFSITMMDEPGVDNVATVIQKGVSRVKRGECFNFWMPEEDLPAEVLADSKYITDNELRNLMWEAIDSDETLSHFGGRTKGEVLTAILASIAFNEESKHIVKQGLKPFTKLTEFYGETPAYYIQLNCLMDLPEPNMGTMTYDTFFRSAAPGGSDDDKFDGVFVDQLTLGGAGGADPVSFRKEHFQYSPFPLVFERTQGKPAMLLTYGNIDFLKSLSKTFRDGDKFVFGNMSATPRQNTFWWYAPYVDILGGDLGYLYPDPDGKYIDMHTYARILRLLAGNEKPIYINYTAEDGHEYGEFLELALLYGIYPYVPEFNEEDFGANPELMGWKDMLPLIKNMNVRGWQSETGVTKEQYSVALMERYGTAEKNDIVIAVYNTLDSKREIKFRVNIRQLGLSSLNGWKDLRTGRDYTPEMTGDNLMMEYEIDGKSTFLLGLDGVPLSDDEKKEYEKELADQAEAEANPTYSEAVFTDFTHEETGLSFSYPEQWGSPQITNEQLTEGSLYRVTFADNANIEGTLHTEKAFEKGKYFYKGDQDPQFACGLFTSMSGFSCDEVENSKQEASAFFAAGFLDNRYISREAMIDLDGDMLVGAQFHLSFPALKIASSSIDDVKTRLAAGETTVAEKVQLEDFHNFLASLSVTQKIEIAEATAPFSDVSLDDPNIEAILALKNKGIVGGYPDGSFKPLNAVNRAEMLKFLFESLELTTIEPTEDCFNDVPKDAWFAKYVCTAKLQGWVEGYEDDVNGGRKFVPWQEVQRVEALKMLGEMDNWNISEGQDQPLFIGEGYESVDMWYIPYIRHARYLGLIDGEGDGTWVPWFSLSRAAMSKIVYRVID